MSHITSYLRRLREQIPSWFSAVRNKCTLPWSLPLTGQWGMLMGSMLLLTLLLGNMGAIAQHFPRFQITTLQAGLPSDSSQKKPVAPEANASPTPEPVRVPSLQAITNTAYTPPEEVAPADPSNYGERYPVDAYGNPVYNDPIIVLHETVGSADSAINTFQTHHPRDADQRSYHSLIRRDGTIVYIVPPEFRAYGAGNSVFVGPDGEETVRTNPDFPPSVNNFAYHISLETPADGRGNQSVHSGYTRSQYQSLAWLTARAQVPWERITTHRAVDRSGTRRDPRSFDSNQFASEWQRFVSP